MPGVLVLYCSATGSVPSLAQSVAPVVEKAAPPVPPEGVPDVEARDLGECVAIARGKRLSDVARRLVP